MSETAIELGDTARDTITGFTGVVTGEFLYLNGCRRLSVQPQELREGKPPLDAFVFDDVQLALVAKRVHAAVPITVPASTGGPRPYPKVQRHDPVR